MLRADAHRISWGHSSYSRRPARFCFSQRCEHRTILNDVPARVHPIDTPSRPFYTPPCHESRPENFPMLKRSLAIVLFAACASFTFAQAPLIDQPTLTPQNSGTTQLLIAVSPVNSQVVWAAGTGGTYVVTTNGAKTWTAGMVQGAEQLQFRDVQGVSDQVAYLMSIGNDSSQFRIYKTEDGGASWT